MLLQFCFTTSTAKIIYSGRQLQGDSNWETRIQIAKALLFIQKSILQQGEIIFI